MAKPRPRHDEHDRGAGGNHQNPRRPAEGRRVHTGRRHPPCNLSHDCDRSVEVFHDRHSATPRSHGLLEMRQGRDEHPSWTPPLVAHRGSMLLCVQHCPTPPHSRLISLPPAGVQSAVCVASNNYSSVDAGAVAFAFLLCVAVPVPAFGTPVLLASVTGDEGSR